MKQQKIPKGPPYNGGKSHIGKDIAAAMDRHIGGEWFRFRHYIEPFCGMLGVMRYVKHESRKASDIDDELIDMWHSVVYDGWLPKLSFTEYTKEMFLKYKIEGKTESNREVGSTHERGFLKYCCTVGACRWGGFLLDTRPGRKNPLDRCQMLFPQLVPHLKSVDFVTCNYMDYDEHNCIFYLDPPYANTTGYSGTPKWDEDAFWTFVLKQKAQNNVIFVSNSLPNIEAAAEKHEFEFTILWQKLYKSGTTSIKKRKIDGSETVASNPARMEVLIAVK
jgi:site-specific DNA-adenine methylase